MKQLIKSIESLKNSNISNIVDKRINQFSSVSNSGIDEIFKELCFCIMTANCGAKKCIEVQQKINDGFLTYSEDELKIKFKEFGYRYPNIRAKYIIEARGYLPDLERQLNSNIDETELRDWIVKFIKGLGYKEASHFLRNIGYRNFAIIDFHIIDLMVSYSIIEKPKALTKKKYLEIETILKEIGDKLKLDMGKLDLYLWYMETSEVLK
ncbi:MAG: N-glycosylase/DNA lyase [Candidatus Lokiarchaeota archaeon]|jgi:N-glycosylase/DNA lyase|nr:N-glycosylase/DNA lyase [Candidatus Lokiarchaeota archaeon]